MGKTMASINLSGILTNAFLGVDVGGVMLFTQLSNTGDTVASTEVKLIIPPDGSYNIDLNFGRIRIDYTTDFTKRYIAEVIVDINSTATTIPELLNAAVPVKEDVIIEMEDILGDAVAAKDAAETAAISGARRFDTKQDMLDDSSSLYVGSVIIIKDRGYAQYVSMPVGAALLDGDIALNTGVIAQLQIKPVNDLRWWGDLNAVNLQAALDRTQTSSSLVAAGGETISCEGLDVPIEQGINFNAGNNIKGGNFRAVSSFWDNNVVDVLNGVVGIPMFSIANVRGCKFTDFVIDGGITTRILIYYTMIITVYGSKLKQVSHQ